MRTNIRYTRLQIQMWLDQSNAYALSPFTLTSSHFLFLFFKIYKVHSLYSVSVCVCVSLSLCRCSSNRTRILYFVSSNLSENVLGMPRRCSFRLPTLAHMLTPLITSIAYLYTFVCVAKREKKRKQIRNMVICLRLTTNKISVYKWIEVHIHITVGCVCRAQGRELIQQQQHL